MLSLPKLFQNPQYLAQVGHTLGGAWLVGLPIIFFGLGWWWTAWFVLLVLSGLKEFWYDTYYGKGEHDSLSDSVMDFAFYQVGAGVACLVMLLAQHLHRIQ